MRRLEPLLWTLLLASLCLFSIHRHGIRLFNDSYQYLSVAESLLTRHEIATTIVFFDPERTHNRLPAPVTTFPPGYPVAIDLLSPLRLAPERAAWLVSFAAMLATVPLLWWTALLLGAPPTLARFAVAAWCLNSTVVAHANSVLTEALFTLLVLSSLALLLYSELHATTASRLALPTGMLLLGLAYWVRYAAILLIAALFVYIVYLAFARRSRLRPWFLAYPLALAPMLAAMLRNVEVAGTWRGGNNLPVHHSLAHVLTDFAKECYLLPFGQSQPLFLLGLLSALFLLALISLLLISARPTTLVRCPRFAHQRSEQANLGEHPARISSSLLLTFALTYIAGMIYLGLRTMINFDTRMFLPIYPLLLLLVLSLLTPLWPARRFPRLAPALATAALLACAACNLYALVRFSPTWNHLLLASYYSEPVSAGLSLRDWAAREIPANSVLVATDGQATGYLLHRPTIATIEPAFSSRRWDEAEVRRTMTAYRAAWLIAYPGLPPTLAPEQLSSPFLRSLAEGRPPAWLTPRLRTPHVILYQLSPNALASSEPQAKNQR